MQPVKSVTSESKGKRSVWIAAIVIILACAVGGWWLAEPGTTDDASQILATAPPAVNAKADASANSP